MATTVRLRDLGNTYGGLTGKTKATLVMVKLNL